MILWKTNKNGCSREGPLDGVYLGQVVDLWTGRGLGTSFQCVPSNTNAVVGGEPDSKVKLGLNTICHHVWPGQCGNRQSTSASRASLAPLPNSPTDRLHSIINISHFDHMRSPGEDHSESMTTTRLSPGANFHGNFRRTSSLRKYWPTI